MKKLLFLIILMIPLANAIPKEQNLEEFFYGGDLYGAIPFSHSDINYTDNCVGFYCIIDFYPVAIPTISPSPADASSNLTCAFLYTDLETAVAAVNYTEWFVNGAIVATSYNLSETFISNNDKVICSMIVFDGTSNSTKTNSSQVTVGDVTPPTINSISISSDSPTQSESVTFSANVTDSDSLLLSTSCKFELYKADYNLGVPINLTSTTKLGDAISAVQSMGQFGLGNLYLNNVYCTDTSGNMRKQASTLTINIKQTAGGGGGYSTQECTKDADCFKFGVGYYCIISKCIKQSVEDRAYINLLAMGIPADFIPAILEDTGRVCDFNGKCDFDQGENIANCGRKTYNINGENTVIEGDCGALGAIPINFLTGSLAALVLGIIFIAYEQRRRKVV